MPQLRIFILLPAFAAILLLAHPALASGDIKGEFTGKIICRDGMKKAEFKAPTTQTLSMSSAGDIKRRIDELTWPGASDTTSFTNREKEKTTLQHALKVLRNYSCEDAAAAAEPPPEPERGTGPGLNPH